MLARTDAGHVHYTLSAWAIAVVPSLALFAARVALGEASLRTPEAAGIAGFAAYSIVVAPLVETMVMVPLALALNALPAKSDWPRAFALAALAALAHGFGGTAWQIAAAFWPFVVYSAALFAWRRRSLQDAYLVAVLIHMLYNATFFAIGLAGLAVAGA
jgi:hypothetical protein